MKTLDSIGDVLGAKMEQVVHRAVPVLPVDTSPSTFLIFSSNSTMSTPLTEARDLHCGHGALLGPLGLIVQFLLAFIAFGALVVKRFCEPKYERRSWIIWFFDTSKQAIGAAVIHFANVFFASIFHGDPCTWYIVSFLLDSTVGLVVIYIGLQISQCVAKCKGNKTMILGEYGSPPKCYAWVVQCGLYVVVMLVEKILMTLLMLFDFWKDVRKIIMSPIKSPQAELILVMFIIPFVVNAFIFWVVDNFLKKKKWKSPRVINSNESAMKYLRSSGLVQYYNRVNHNEDSDSDRLLSLDDDDTDGPKPDCLLSPDRESGFVSQEQLGLLSPEASVI